MVTRLGQLTYYFHVKFTVSLILKHTLLIQVRCFKRTITITKPSLFQKMLPKLTNLELTHIFEVRC